MRGLLAALVRPKRVWTTFLIDGLLILLATFVLIRPWFRAKYLARWASIESTFISDARFLQDHWPHPQWQPLWYGGTRFDYVYPPALRYGTAALAKYYPMLPVKAYHIYTGFFYCVGMFAVYVMIRRGCGSRGAAWLGAAATALLSPSYLLITRIRDDTSLFEPWRLDALVRYGEGPHMTAVALIPFALAASWTAIRQLRPLPFALAAFSSALVVSHNFYGAISLAILFPLLLWSLWITHQDNRMFLRAGAIVVCSYGLTAAWLVPSYIGVTLANMEWVSERGNVWSVWIALAAAIVYLLATNKWARGRTERAWPVFLIGSCAFFTLNVLGNELMGFRVVGEPGRLIPEWDLAIILLAVEGLRRMWICQCRPPIRLVVRIAAAVLACAALGTSYRYLGGSRTFYPADPDVEKRVEYRMPDWLARNLPGSRVMATGTVRFWLNAWHDVPQLGGGSEQGLLNPVVMPAQWEVNLGESQELTLLWLQGLGVDAVVVPGMKSPEHYHDIQYPRKFVGLPVLHDDGQDTVIYRVPRRYPGLARVVESSRLDAVPPLPKIGEHLPTLRAYTDAVEKGPEAPPSTAWQGTDELVVRGRLDAGQSFVVQVSYDPAWRAYSSGTRMPIRADAFGFMRIDAPAGEHELRLRFETPLENLVGRLLTGLTLGALIALVVVSRHRKVVF